MKKIMNVPAEFVDESLRGILLAHGDELAAAAGNLRAIVRSDAPVQGKVAIVTGGGYGHLPLFLGYVGKGLCDGCAVGNVFTAPSCEAIMETARQVNGGKGVLFLFGNYMGDQMNFEMASEFLADEGIKTAIIRAADDTASAPRDSWQERRGVAGIFFAYKIAGALAEKGLSLEEVTRRTLEACEAIASFGVSFSSCQLPESPAPIFELSENDMELGMGIHGEKGVSRCAMMSADELARYMLSRVTEDLSLKAGDRTAVLVNGLGATSREELYILYGAIAKLLEEEGISVAKAFVGEYVTSLEMAGASISLIKLDGEREDLLADPMHTPFVRS